MLKLRADKTLREIGIKNIYPPIYIDSKIWLHFEICKNIKNYKKGLKKALKLYNKLNFDTLIFKVEFLRAKENTSENLEYTLTILNKFIDISGVKKPLEMKKIKRNNQNNIISEIIYFYWDLSTEKIKIKELFKEIIFLDFGGFNELFASVFFLDTNKHILFNLYDNRGVDILASKSQDLYKLYKSHRKWILKEELDQIDKMFKNN